MCFILSSDRKEWERIWPSCCQLRWKWLYQLHLLNVGIIQDCKDNDLETNQQRLVCSQETNGTHLCTTQAIHNSGTVSRLEAGRKEREGWTSPPVFLGTKRYYKESAACSYSWEFAPHLVQHTEATKELHSDAAATAHVSFQSLINCKDFNMVPLYLEKSLDRAGWRYHTLAFTPAVDLAPCTTELHMV